MSDSVDHTATQGAAGEDPPEPAPLRRLRRLVTLLTVVLILGMVAVSATLVIRLSSLGEGAAANGAALARLVEGAGVAVDRRAPAELRLAPGERILAVGGGPRAAVALTELDGVRQIRVLPLGEGAGPEIAVPVVEPGQAAAITAPERSLQE